MISAIASYATYTTVGAVASPAALEAQLAKYQKELADCVNCASAKTLEGRAKIDEISGKISNINARLEKVVSAATSSRSGAFAAGNATDSSAQPNTLNSTPQTSSLGKLTYAPDSSNTLTGSRINVYA